MKIQIKADRRNIRLWLPTGLLKGRIGYSIVKQALKNNYDRSKEKRGLPAEEQANEDAVVSKQAEFQMPLSRDQVKELYAILKRTIKTHGHFNLVEVESAEGERVVIRV